MKDQINKAIGAHGLWKARLRRAIDTGAAEVDAQKAASVRQCDFGKWLHGDTLSAPAKNSPSYKTVVKLHADFHRCAGKVTRLALDGRKDEATQAMTAEFDKTSMELVTEMMKWKNSA